MKIKLLSSSDAPKIISEFYLKNSDHLCPWEPLREEGFHTAEAWQTRLQVREQEQLKGLSAYFMSYNESGTEIIAVSSLTNIVRGPFLACNIGYSIAEQYQGHGLMKNLCVHVIDYAFEELGLNRIMANYIPRNKRSAALLDNLGFACEGRAKKYLLINGKWEDHVLTSLLNPKNI